jgi:hypothetical protein
MDGTPRTETGIHQSDHNVYLKCLLALSQPFVNNLRHVRVSALHSSTFGTGGQHNKLKNMKRNGLSLFGLALLLSTARVPAIEGMRLTVQGSNAVITWPSTDEQSYYVRHRSTLDTNTPWAFLANNINAAEGTNRTAFTHVGAVLYPPPAQGGGGPAGGPPPAPGRSMMSSSSGVGWFDLWKYEDRDPYIWEIEQRPPLPWDPDVWILREHQALSADGSILMSEGGGTNATMGFYSVEPAASAYILLANNTLLSNIVNISVALYATGTNKIVSIQLLDITDGETNLLGWTDQSGLTNVSFAIDTSYLKIGNRDLQVRVEDNNGPALTGEFANTGYSPVVRVRVANPIYFYRYETPEVGWKIRVGFGTTEPNGTWSIDIRDPQGTLYATANGDIATSTNSQGFIIREDDTIFDPGLGDNRLRNYYDQYSEEYFDVTITVRGVAQGSPPASPPAKVKNVRKRVKSRPHQRLGCVVEDISVIGDTGNRSTMDAMMDAVLQGFGMLGQHFDLPTMTLEDTPTPGSEGWNIINQPALWRNLNYFVAGTNTTVQPATHFFSFSHGWGGGIGREGAGIDGSMTTETLQSLGYWGHSNVVFQGGKATLPFRPRGMTFAFVDGCDTMTGSIVDVLVGGVMSYGGRGKITLDQLQQYGSFPHYGCGWTKKKGSKFRGTTDILIDHADYVGLFFEWLLTIDPNTGLPRFTYQQARERARHTRLNDSVINPVALGWDHTGCDELFIDE